MGIAQLHQILKGLEDTYEGAEKDRYPAIFLPNTIAIPTDEGQVKTRLIQLVDLTSSGNVLPKNFDKKVGSPITVICDNAHHITKALCLVKKVSFS